MFRRHGAILINLLQAVAWLLLLGLPMAGRAISVGNLTFSLGAEENFVAKRVLNNNPSARLYQISVVGIDRPGGHEVVRVRQTANCSLPRVSSPCRPGKGNTLNFIIMARRIIVNVITGFRFAKFPPETALAVLRPAGQSVLIRWS